MFACTPNERVFKVRQSIYILRKSLYIQQHCEGLTQAHTLLKKVSKHHILETGNSADKLFFDIF